MNKLIITTIAVLFVQLASAQEKEIVSPPDSAESNTRKSTPPPKGIFSQVEEPAEFKGGKEALSKYLSKNLQYPKIAIEAELEGKCYVRFVITKKGKVIQPTIVKRVPGCPECDEEAVRVVSKMPKWKPAKVKGKAVDSFFNLPITFKLV